ncbi:shadow of prion protein 2 [Corythoichthys intestinalis]|uniref:shadow of prion protein 2 n=1 Tax=Corythoichthys intestinalis TaxID=161448 RepID=UPI0025A4FF44|nr:shadow of prion protein 2 [Corythoichthys intestinalis]
MTGQQKLVSLWLLSLLIVALCPGAQYTHSKRAQKGGKSNKTPASKGPGLPKQGLKWAGAAGMLGGTGTGYGLGFLGRAKHGSRGHAGHKTASTENHGQTFYNQSRWRAFLKAAAPAHMSNLFFTMRHALTFLTGICMCKL